MTNYENMKAEFIVTHKPMMGSGLYSMYFKLTDSIGVKVLKQKTLSAAYCEAMAEYKLLKQAEPSGVSPKPIGVFKVIVKVSGENVERFGIVMSHCGNTTLTDYCYDKGISSMDVRFKGFNLSRYCQEKMDAVGIDIGDRHGGNITLDVDNDGEIKAVYCIDFSPDYTYAPA